MILTAKQEGFAAIYGEALTMHPFSQKANLRHKMIESAISLGIVPSSMEIEESIKTAQKSGAMIAYLLFKPKKRKLNLPKRYKKELLQVYKRANLDLIILEPKEDKDKELQVNINEILNSGTIIIKSPFELSNFISTFESLRHAQFDMIFADINLEHIKNIDSVIEKLTNLGFFYSGLLFEYYENEDYLRLQYINSLKIDIEEVICYSRDANNMMSFIQEDYQKVSISSLKTS